MIKCIQDVCKCNMIETIENLKVELKVKLVDDKIKEYNIKIYDASFYEKKF